MVLTDFLDARSVKVPLRSRTKEEVLSELVGLAVGDRGLPIVEAVLGAVLERERTLSTGIGEGIAIPHARTRHVDRVTMAAGVAPHPIDFNAVDGRPVELFFLLVAPESASGDHVRALSRLSRLLRRDELRDELRAAGTAAGFLRAVERADPN